MSNVFVLDTERRPMDPVHPGEARRKLSRGEAAVFRHYPFTIILKEATPMATPALLRVKVDPGSKTTGLALVDDAAGSVVWAAEVAHRGEAIKARLTARRALRHGRRARKTRYRQPRFLNRRRPEGWLPPSLGSRVANVMAWVGRLRRYAPVDAISVEVVRFDTQSMQNPEISGVEYQQGELAGYEVRQYLLLKFNRTCVFCGAKGEGVRLEVEHVVPRSRGGSDRVSNLALACEPCNKAKGAMTAAEFGHPEVQGRCKAPLKDAAAVNATRWALYGQLKAMGLPVEVGTGGRTAYNRAKRGMPKAHWVDAACVGAGTPEALSIAGVAPLQIRAMGRGTRQMCGTDKYGFPIHHRSRVRTFGGYRTGDVVRAVVPTGKYRGTRVGRVTIRQRPCFCVCGVNVHPKYLALIQKGDGYDYAHSRALSPAA